LSLMVFGHAAVFEPFKIMRKNQINTFAFKTGKKPY